MNKIKIFLYRMGIFLLKIIMIVFSPFSKKIKKGIIGRKNVFDEIEKDMNEIGEKKILWIHCASLGEYEQGVPIMKKILNTYTNSVFLLTFFSPSGYEIRKNNPFTKYVYYLPLDTPTNAQKFIDIIHPALVFFVKYDYWYHYISVLNKKNIPLFIISSYATENYFLFSFFFSFLKTSLKKNVFFTQDKNSVHILKKKGIQKAYYTGDTRIDRVKERVSSCKVYPKIIEFIGSSPTLILGSVWEKDMKLVAHSLKKISLDMKLIIAPHEISDRQKKYAKKYFGNNYIYYSKYATENKHKKILFIDSIGILAELYQYATCVFIGGGLSNQLHNILEPAVFGVPVVFGYHKNVFKKYPESLLLKNVGGAFSIKDSQEGGEIFEKLFNDITLCKSISINLKKFMEKQPHSKERIIDYLEKNNFLDR